MLQNCDINVVAVFAKVVVSGRKIQTVHWTIGAQFWDFLFFDHTLRSWQTDSPSRTLIRLAFKSYQMGIPFDKGLLSPLEGEFFNSHKTKLLEMDQKWDQYPFKTYRLKAKSKKSFVFRKAYVICSCGHKGNISCTFEKCFKCCKKQSSICKIHKE